MRFNLRYLSLGFGAIGFIAAFAGIFFGKWYETSIGYSNFEMTLALICVSNAFMLILLDERKGVE